MKKWLSILVILVVVTIYPLYEKGMIPRFGYDDTPTTQEVSHRNERIKMPKNVVPVKLDHVVDGDTVNEELHPCPTVWNLLY